MSEENKIHDWEQEWNDLSLERLTGGSMTHDHARDLAHWFGAGGVLPDPGLPPIPPE